MSEKTQEYRTSFGTKELVEAIAKMRVEGGKKRDLPKVLGLDPSDEDSMKKVDSAIRQLKTAGVKIDFRQVQPKAELTAEQVAEYNDILNGTPETADADADVEEVAA